MGKFRAHQDKSRRGRGKSRLKKKGYTGGGGQKGGVAAGTLSRANGHGRPDEQHKGGHADMDETAVSVSVSGAEAGGGGARKKKPRHVTYGKEHSVLICGDGDFSFTRGVIRHRGTGVGVVATSLDSRDAVLNKYPRAESWLAQLDEDGAQVRTSTVHEFKGLLSRMYVYVPVCCMYVYVCCMYVYVCCMYVCIASPHRSTRAIELLYRAIEV